MCIIASDYRLPFVGTLTFAISLICWQSGFAQQSPSVVDRIQKATEKLNKQQLFHLEYKMAKGEEFRWTVEHVASTKTQMAGELEETSSRSRSTKLWRVSSVDSLGNITFVHSLEDANMWQKIGDLEPVAYNSQTDKEVPDEYKAMSEKLGKPLAVISITPNGEVTDRKSSLKSARFGTGEITMPLPKQPIPVGDKWTVPIELQGTDEEGNHRKLKARILYELVKVKDGNAYISFRTEVLTPVQSEKIRSQIMQQMTKGYAVFDIAKGCLVRKEIEWDEKVQGYQGADSFLQYLGRMTEKLTSVRVSGSKTTSTTGPLAPLGTQAAHEDAKIKTRDGKPIMRK
jgi:hypothetical protein